MRKSISMLLAATLLTAAVLPLTGRADDKQPAPKITLPKSGKPMIGEMNLQTIQPIHYFSDSHKATIDQIGDVVMQSMAGLIKAAGDGQFHVAGPSMLVFHGQMTGGDAFTLQVGFVTGGDAKAVAPYKFETLENFRCATILYTGPITGIEEAYKKLFEDMSDAGLTPTDESRQMILFWEGPDSPNNVIQIQIGLQGL